MTGGPFDDDLPAGVWESDYDMRELEEAARRHKREARATAPAQSVPYRAFIAWLVTRTYAEAERAYRDGSLSEDGWTAYRVAWALGAARFSPLAEYGRALAHQACAPAPLPQLPLPF